VGPICIPKLTLRLLETLHTNLLRMRQPCILGYSANCTVIKPVVRQFKTVIVKGVRIQFTITLAPGQNKCMAVTLSEYMPTQSLAVECQVNSVQKTLLCPRP